MGENRILTYYGLKQLNKYPSVGLKAIIDMIEYATSDNNCRSRMLLRYFGEKNEHNCGICDVCLQKKKESSTLSTSEYKNIQKEIIHLLAEQPLTTDALRKRLPSVTKEKLVLVLRHLLDEKYIVQENGILKAHS